MKAVAITVVLFISAVAGAAPVHIDIGLIGTPEQQVAVRLTLTPGSTEREAVSAEVMAPGSTIVELAQGTTWSADASADGYWPASAVVIPGIRGGEQVKLDLWPTGELTGQLRIEEGEQMPDEVLIRFSAPPDTDESGYPEDEIRCPVAQAKLKCTLPAALFDLRVRARGFVSHYIWGMSVPPAGSFDAGLLQLRRGASVVGMLRVDADEVDLRDCQVELAPYSPSLVDPKDMQRRRGLALTTDVSERGFFHFEGVKPGSYQLEAQLQGLAPARFFPVMVMEGSETSISDPITITPPATLSIEIEPSADPWGREWQVTLAYRSAHPTLSIRVSQEVVPGGLLELNGLSTGDYLVQVEDVDGNNWLFEQLTVFGGAQHERFEVPVVPVRGFVRRGDEPIPADIWMGGRQGAIRVHFQSDEEGEFLGYLPREGLWSASVVGNGGRLQRSFKLLVERDSDGEADIEITIPDTVVSGKVVYEEGQAAPNTMIQINTANPTELAPTLRSDEDGHFAVEGLPAGTTILAAKDATGLQADPVTVELREGEVAEVSLVLRRTLTISGSVVGPFGGLAGVELSGMPVGRFSDASQVTAVTDVSGSFSFRIPDWATAVNLVVLAPGYAMRALRPAVSPSTPLTIQVAQNGGTLDLGLAQEFDQPRLFIVHHNSGLVPIPDLQRWARVNGAGDGILQPGTRLSVPAMEPGEYSLCAVRIEELASILTGALPSSCSAPQTLAPGGELEILSSSVESQ